MERFDNILIAATPGRLEAVSLRRIGELAAANRAKVTVIDVIEPLPRWRRVVNVEGHSVDIEHMMLGHRQEQLQRLADLTDLSQVEVVVKTGKPAVEVIRYVVEHGCNLVAVGEAAPDKNAATGVSAGVMQLLRKCPAPVWVMRRTRARTHRILALVDPDPTDPVRDGLNELVIGLAMSMARRVDGRLHVAHAWQLEGEATLASSPFVSVPGMDLELIRSALAEEHRTKLQELADRHGVSESGGELHLVNGPPGTVLPRLAKELEITLIVMGTVARTGLSGFIMGNTAETILRSVGCSLLALKPAGFETPIRLGHERGKAEA